MAVTEKGRPNAVFLREETEKRFGKEFFTKLTKAVEFYSTAWQLGSLVQIDYFSVNCLFTCFSQEFGDCVFKFGPYTRETITEYKALKFYEGSRFCRVFKADAENGALLLERISPATRLRELPALESRLREFCNIYHGLHRETDDISLPTYLGWVKRIAAFLREKAPELPVTAHMNSAEEICESLCKKYRGRMLLHGDLHHDNILLGSDGYRIIDPKGVVGDAVFDLPRFVINEFGETTDDSFAEKYAVIIDYLSSHIGVPKLDLLMLVYIEICMANAWSVESGERVDMSGIIFAEREMKREIHTV